MLSASEFDELSAIVQRPILAEEASFVRVVFTKKRERVRSFSLVRRVYAQLVFFHFVCSLVPVLIKNNSHTAPDIFLPPPSQYRHALGWTPTSAAAWDCVRPARWRASLISEGLGMVCFPLVAKLIHHSRQVFEVIGGVVAFPCGGKLVGIVCILP